LASTDIIFIGFEILTIFLFFMYAHLTVGDVRMSIKVFEFGGALSGYFWIGVVLLGLTIPAILETIKVLPRLLGNGPYVHSGVIVVVVPAMVIAGGFVLRYVIVVGGQIAKLAGI
jgi:formate-dependent nitrite reductase membrane component NrfD